jgi:AbrB family looped-hinge helix DNA binding protein
VVIIKKIDDIGRIAIPRDVRRALRWMGGDEIEIIPKDNGELVLRKRQVDTIPVLNELRQDWQDDLDVNEQFEELIKLIESKTK